MTEATACTSCGGLHEVGAPCVLEDREGQLVGDKYLIRRLLGEGGMGAVYEARHQVVGRRFAIKFLRSELARKPQMLARFRREAQAAGSLENENIAAITDFGTAADGSPYIVMEYLEGEDLASFLHRNGPLPPARAALFVLQACRGLNAAHENGIVHRDLKPENLFLCQRGDGSDLIKVLDFGIAKLRQPDVSPDLSTQTGMALGTPYYMSPEQAQGRKEIDHRVDIYALGVILYELLSGQRPHGGDGYNAVLYHIATRPPVPLESLRPDLPGALLAVVARALAREPEHRFASAAELAAALAPLTTPSVAAPAARVADASARVEVTQPLLPSDRPAESLTPSPTARTSPRVPAARRGGLWLLGAVASAAALLLVALLLQRRFLAGDARPDGSAAASVPPRPSPAQLPARPSAGAAVATAQASAAPASKPTPPASASSRSAPITSMPAAARPSARSPTPSPPLTLPSNKTVPGSRADLYKP